MEGHVEDSRYLTYAPKELQRRLGCRDWPGYLSLVFVSHPATNWDKMVPPMFSSISRKACREEPVLPGWINISLVLTLWQWLRTTAYRGRRFYLCSLLLLHPGSLWSFLLSSFCLYSERKDSSRRGIRLQLSSVWQRNSKVVLPFSF